MARIRRNDTRPGVPVAGTPPAGKADLHQWKNADPHSDIMRFVVRYGRVGSKDKGRACSEATMTARRKRLARAFDLLSAANRGVKTLADMKPKHLPLMVQTWESAGIAPRTQVQMFAVLKWFWRMHGITDGVRNIKAHVPEPERYVVHGAAQIDRSVKGQGVDVFEVLRRLDALDPRAGAFARLAWATGLRRLECLRLHPHEDLVGDELRISRGSKGGRPRIIPLKDAGPERAAVALDAIKTLRELSPPGGHGGWPDLKLQQSYRRLGSLLERVGLTKAELGTTMHGLRHDFAIDLLEELSGVTAPVRGGLCVDYAKLREHMRRVSGLLGHNRPKVTNAYYGSMREMNKLALDRVFRSWGMLRPGLEGALTILRRHGLSQLYLVGLRAKGANSTDTDAFEFALPSTGHLPAAQVILLLREMQQYWQTHLLAPAYVALAPEPDAGKAPTGKLAKIIAAAQVLQMPLYANDQQDVEAVCASDQRKQIRARAKAQMALDLDSAAT